MTLYVEQLKKVISEKNQMDAFSHFGQSYTILRKNKEVATMGSNFYHVCSKQFGARNMCLKMSFAL
jgi:hypothetical protein